MQMRLPLLALAACLLGACSTVTVNTDYDHSTSFAKYKSYSLAPASHGLALSPSGEAALRDTLGTQLAQRGIRPAAHGKADLAVVRHVFMKEKTSVHQYTDWGYGYGGAWPYGYGYYHPWSGAPRTYVNVDQFTEGTLILDFVDTRTNKLVFRGTGVAIVGQAGTNADKIRRAVEKIVAKFPVAPKQ